MDLKNAHNGMEKYFASHTKGQLLKSLYGDSIEKLKNLNKDLWKESIDKQIEINDEDVYVLNESDKSYKYLDLINNWSSLIDDKLPWQYVDESYFPVQFLILENDGKKIVLSVMIGQGSSVTICSEEKFKAWMNRCENKYTYDESKYVSIDDLGNITEMTINMYLESFKEE